MDGRRGHHGIGRILVLAAALCAAALVSCGRPAKPESAPVPPPGDEIRFPLEAGGSLTLTLVGNGLAASDPAAASAAPEPFAVHPAVAAVQPLPSGGAVIAVNRVGLFQARVERGSAVSLSLQPVPGGEGEFAGRTVGATWARDGAAMVFLYRHPIFETAAERSPSHALLRVDSRGAELLSGPAGYGAGRQLFALYPRGGGLVLAQSREAAAEGWESSYGAWDPAAGTMSPMTRDRFERSLAPAPLADCSPALRACLLSLGGDIVADVRLADGSRASYLKGSLDEAVTAAAFDGPEGALVVAADGRLAWIKADGAVAGTMILSRPVPDAVFRDAAIADGAALVAWEEDLFPDTGRSGLVVLDLGL